MSAASLPVRRMRSMMSADLTRGSSQRSTVPPSAQVGFGIVSGTVLIGEMVPCRMGVEAPLWQRLYFLPLPHQQASFAFGRPAIEPAYGLWVGSAQPNDVDHNQPSRCSDRYID